MKDQRYFIVLQRGDRTVREYTLDSKGIFKIATNDPALFYKNEAHIFARQILNETSKRDPTDKIFLLSENGRFTRVRPNVYTPKRFYKKNPSRRKYRKNPDTPSWRDSLNAREAEGIRRAEARREEIREKVAKGIYGREVGTVPFNHMLRALQMAPWLNTVDDWQRYHEAKMIQKMKRKK